MKQYIYFDHNIFNRMVRGEENEIQMYYESKDLTPIFSDENVDEIDRSIKRRESFYDLLDRMGASHIGIPLDEKFNHKGFLKIENKSARTRSLELAEARAGYEGESNGLDFLTKIYGGLKDASFSGIISAQLDEAEESLKEVLAEIDPQDLSLATTRNEIIESLNKIPKIREESSVGLGEMDERSEEGSLSDQIQREIGVTSIELGNINYPDVVDKIWNLVGHKFGGPDNTLIDYLDKIDSFSEDGPDTQPRSIKLINGIYNWLNIIGFCRDEGLNKPKRMKASFGDMTHAGYGVTCEMFLCNDQKMRRKIEATYDYLSVDCKIVSYEGLESDVHS